MPGFFCFVLLLFYFLHFMFQFFFYFDMFCSAGARATICYCNCILYADAWMAMSIPFSTKQAVASKSYVLRGSPDAQPQIDGDSKNRRRRRKKGIKTSTTATIILLLFIYFFTSGDENFLRHRKLPHVQLLDDRFN